MSDELLIRIDERVKNIENHVNNLSKVVVGNGQPEKALTHRIAKIEEQTSFCRSNVDKRFLDLKQDKRDSKRTKTDIALSVIRALAMIVVALIALLK